MAPRLAREAPCWGSAEEAPRRAVDCVVVIDPLRLFPAAVCLCADGPVGLIATHEMITNYEYA